MTNKDVFKILLCSYGYDRNIKIETFYGGSLSIGYDIHAENKEGDEYDEIGCEGFMYHVYSILAYMQECGAKFKTDWWNCSPKYAVDDNLRKSIIGQWNKRDKEMENNREMLAPIFKWYKENNPCPNCSINKHDHWDDIHYNCELAHTHTCKILITYLDEYGTRLRAVNTKQSNDDLKKEKEEK